MSLSNLDLLSPADYFGLLYEMLKLRENPWLYYGTGYQRIHNGGGDGNPTFGYGFNLAAFSGDVVREAILYAYDYNLSPQQADGLDLVLAWKFGAPVIIDGVSRILTNADVINLADVNLNGSASGIGSASQRAAVQSLYLNDAQGTKLLDVVVKGELDLVHIEGPDYGFEAGLDYRLVEEGVLPYSTERAALISVYYNAPSLIGPGVQNEISQDDRPTLWYEVRYNHNHFNHKGLQNRRAEEADLLGLVSRTAKDDPAQHIDEYASALDVLFNGFDRLGRRLYPRIEERDGLDPFPQAAGDELEILRQILAVAATGDASAPSIDFVQVDPYHISAQIDASDASAAGITGGKNYLETVNLIMARAGDDVIRGFGQTDYLYGGDGDDTLIGDGAGLSDALAGDDLLHGGPGIDTADYTMEPGAVSLTYAGENARGEAMLAAIDGYGRKDTLVRIEVVHFGDGHDHADILGFSASITLHAAGGNDVISTGAGDDTVSGGEGDDTLSGIGGRDHLSGDDGADLLTGGAGDDLLFGATGADTMKGEAGRDLIAGGHDNDLLFGFGSHDTLSGGGGDDDLRGGYGRDLLNGAAGNDVARGFEGPDRLFGGGGDDTLIGNDDDDLLIGGGRHDILKGDAGDDTLRGSYGDDTVTGGDGDDVFEYREGHGADTIVDFSAGAGSEDTIRLIAFGPAFDAYAEILSAASQSGADVVIDFGDGDSLLLQNTSLDALAPDDFLFG